MKRITLALAFITAAVACGGQDCDDVEITDLCVPGACAPPKPAEVYGPCDANGCIDMCLPLGSGSVCTAACEDASDCDPCSPDGAKVTCISGQCVVQCTLGGATCPIGMFCDLPTNFCAWPFKGAL